MRGWRSRKRVVTQRRQRQRGRDRADPQRALQPAAQAARLLLEALDVGERALRPAEDQLALGRQRLELAPAAHQRHAELALEAADAGRQRRLGDVAGGRRAAEVALAVERGQVLELPDEHRIDDRPRSINASVGSTWTSAAYATTMHRLCRAIWWNWSAATMSRERRPRSTCSKRRWINAERSPTTTAGSPRSARACPRRRSTASRRSTTTCCVPRGRAPRARLHRARRASPPPATRTSTRSSEALGLELGERSEDGRVSLAETVCLGFCHASPGGPRRRRRSTPARARSSACSPTRRSPRPSRSSRSLLDEPVLTRPGDWSGCAQALDRHARGAARGGQGRRRPRPRRRRLPRRHEVGVRARSRRAREQVHRRQRRRGRPRLLHRQAADGGQPAPAARGPGARRLRGRRRPRLRPRPLASTRAPSPRSTRRSSEAARRRAILGERFDVTDRRGRRLLRRRRGDRAARAACRACAATVSARPPFPAERGVHGLPTVVNNVETLCNIAVHRRATAPTPTARSAPRRDPGHASSSASTSASPGPASTRSRSG